MFLSSKIIASFQHIQKIVSVVFMNTNLNEFYIVSTMIWMSKWKIEIG